MKNYLDDDLSRRRFESGAGRVRALQPRFNYQLPLGSRAVKMCLLCTLTEIRRFQTQKTIILASLFMLHFLFLTPFIKRYIEIFSHQHVLRRHPASHPTRYQCADVPSSSINAIRQSHFWCRVEGRPPAPAPEILESRQIVLVFFNYITITYYSLEFKKSPIMTK